MSRIEKTVFISYRRTNVSWALAVYQNLTMNGFDAFFDYQGLASGDFGQVILENIKARAHFIVILTSHTLARCTDPEDWLRREIECALESRRNIVPLLLEGVDMSSPAVTKYLAAPPLNRLTQYNALTIPAAYFDEAMERLRSRHLNIPLNAVIHPPSLLAAQLAADQQTAANTAATVPERELSAAEWFERGLQAKQPDEKVRCFTASIILNPSVPTPYYFRGKVHELARDLDSALSDFDTVIQLDAGHAQALARRGAIRRLKDDFSGAMADYDAALKVKPLTLAHHNRGILHELRGDWDSALSDFEAAIALKPDLAVAHRGRARVLREKGEAEKALASADRAISLRPGYVSAYITRATINEALEDWDSAMRDYSEALQHRPSACAAYYNRGMLKKRFGDYAGAVEDLEAYLAHGGGTVDGDEEPTRSLIQELRNWLI